MSYIPAFLRCLFMIVVFCMCYGTTMSQKERPLSDSLYKASYDTMITTRLYASEKYLTLYIKDKGDAPMLRYQPNSKLNLGIGATYGWLTINLSAGLTNSNSVLEKGKTRAIDLQAHLYGPKIVIDLLAQNYKGMYLAPAGTGIQNKTDWYVRPDINLLQAGLAGYYVFNWRKFSYRAAYLQNEWQLKSAGSFLLGGELVYQQATADSSFVPSSLQTSFRSAGISTIRYGDIAPGIGYAYTLVIAKHFFVSGAVTASLSMNLLKESGINQSESHFSINPNYGVKTAVGYNSKRFTTSVTWVNSTIVASGSNAVYASHAGNARFHVAYRFNAGPSFKKRFARLQRSIL